MAARDDVLWENILRTRYLGDTSFFEYKAKSGDSLVWKGILSTRDLVRKDACFKLGDVWLVNLWTDPLIIWLERKRPKSKNGASVEGIDKVAHLINQARPS